jgi:hypothetical protein
MEMVEDVVMHPQLVREAPGCSCFFILVSGEIMGTQDGMYL